METGWRPEGRGRGLFWQGDVRFGFALDKAQRGGGGCQDRPTVGENEKKPAAGRNRAGQEGSVRC